MDRRRQGSGSEPARPTMADEPSPGPDSAQPTVYQIRVKGHLDDRSADWHEALSVRRDDSGDTVLTVRVVDQAALHGLLRKLRDVGVPLVSINPAPPGQALSSDREERQ